MRVIIWLQGEARIAADSATHGCCGTGVDAPVLCVKSLVVSGGQVLENSPLAAVGDREAVGSRILRSNLHQMRHNFNKGERLLVSNNQDI